MNALPLDHWELRFDDQPDWRPVPVPGCWEDAGYPMDRPGPAWYRARLAVPPGWSAPRAWLRFGAVSYHCQVFVGGQLRGEHTGAWDPFDVEVTADVAPGREIEVLLRVEKPASPTAGPSSPAVPGAFPLHTTLAGFLPYVWGHMFGGVWQPVALAGTPDVVIREAVARGTPDGQVEVTAALSGAGSVTLTLRSPDGELLHAAEAAPAAALGGAAGEGQAVPAADQQVVRLTATVPDPRPWSPADPAIYTALLRTDGGDERLLRFGLRSVRADGPTLLLNERPVYPRMILSWGWYDGRLSPDPGPERVRRDFQELRRLGYNGVKLCLWVPPQYYFDLADELGMLLWLELPMWLPEPDEHFRRQVGPEYERIVRLARQHPSVLLYSLGCELNRAVGPDLLGPLYAMVKREGGGGLVRDNSGSGEAYGGLLNEFADYYDYHFYCDIQHFRNLVDYFSPRWRTPQPWIFGEFCDYDTFRDVRRLRAARGREGAKTRGLAGRGTSAATGRPPRARRRSGVRVAGPQNRLRALVSSRLRGSSPWWLSGDPKVNPQGARWQMDVPHHLGRLRANGFLGRGAELERLSELHGLLHRKFTIELVRTYREIAGYVITGEVDTPISTAGMWDDAGRLKFDPRDFGAFNADLVLAVGWDKRRDWVNGGDRAAYWDSFSYTSGAVLRPHLVASHYGQAEGPALVAWSASFAGEAPFASGEQVTGFSLAPGDVRELAVAELLAPDVAAPRMATLSARARIGPEETANEWPLWIFPRGAWDGLRGVALLDPAGRLEGLRRLAPGVVALASAPAADQRVVIATVWSPELEALVRAGGRAVLLQEGGAPGPVPAVAMPFWREAVRLCEPHPAWGDFPHDGWAGLQLYGCATDHALDTAPLGAAARPILRRVDTRTMHIHDYAAEIVWGQGRLIVSTLRFHGGGGDQPVGIARNTAAAHLLSRWVSYLSSML